MTVPESTCLREHGQGEKQQEWDAAKAVGWGIAEYDAERRQDQSMKSLEFHSIVTQWLSPVWLFATPWTSVCQASATFTIFQCLLKLMSIGLMMPSNYLILCCPLLLLPSIFPNIRVFSSELALHLRWPKYWSLSFCISSSNEHSGLISMPKKRRACF